MLDSLLQLRLFGGNFVFPPKQVLNPVPSPEPSLTDYSPYSVSKKIVHSGSFIEVYEYSKPYWVGFPRYRANFVRFKRSKSQAEQESIRDDNVRRTRQQIRRLVNSNSDMNKFLTLTFREEFVAVDLETANRYFNLFIKRLTRLYPKLKYIAIPEFQSDYYFRSGVKKAYGGAVHYHLLLNLPFVPVSEIESVWSYGFVKLNRIDNIDNVGAYVCKYLGKANFDKRYFHKKKFFRSLNLLFPVIIDKISQVADFLSYFSLNALVEKFRISYCSKYHGVVQYSQYRTYT